MVCILSDTLTEELLQTKEGNAAALAIMVLADFTWLLGAQDSVWDGNIWEMFTSEDMK